MNSRIRVYPWEKIIVEGRARIIIPDPEKYRRPDGRFEPAWAPVFYNPLMKLNRDITVLILKHYYNGRGFFIEALGGTGVRGVRIAVETGMDGLINDVDPIAYYYITRNIELNDLSNRVMAYNNEANTLLNNYTFTGIFVDYIDIDPYGSPIPYIDSAVKPLSRNALLGVTATDTGPLTCSHKSKTLRRYGVRCYKTDFSKELGLRILIYNLVFRAAGQDVALYPVFSYSHKYYYRVFFKTVRRGMDAYRIIDECRGYIWYCPEDLSRGFIKDPSELDPKNTGCRIAVLGPLWICSLGSTGLAEKLIDEARGSDIYGESIPLLKLLRGDYLVDTPYYRYDKLFGLYKKYMPPINKFIERLREEGFKAYRSHFDPRGIKTDAPYGELVKIVTSF